MKRKPIDPPHLGQLLRAYEKAHRISQAAWARAQGVDSRQVLRYLNRPDMSVHTLFKICQVLQHNFLAEIAAQLPPDYPPEPADNPLAEKVDRLQQENERLRTQVATLKEALALVGGKG